jgi:DNA-binding NarL/FixJ family response regulator
VKRVRRLLGRRLPTLASPHTVVRSGRTHGTNPDVVAGLVVRKRKASPLDELTPRERQVLALIAEGRSNVGIAHELVVTVAAVERHVTSIFNKLGLHQSPDQHRRVLAVLTYLRA